MLGSVKWSEEICFRGMKGVGRVMAVEQIGKVGGFIEEFGWCAKEDAVAVVTSG